MAAKKEPKKPGDVVKALDDGMDVYVDILKTLPPDAAEYKDALTKVRKRYREYAIKFAIKNLSKNSTKGTKSLRPVATEIADDALDRLLFGRHGKRSGRDGEAGRQGEPAIKRFVPGQSSLATFIGNIIRHVMSEDYRQHARELSASTSGREDQAGFEETTAAETPTPEEVAEEAEEREYSQAEINAIKRALDAGELDSEQEAVAMRILDQYTTGKSHAALEREQASAIEGALDALSEDEQQVIGMRQEGMSYKAIAAEMFPSDEPKKAVQKVMVRLHRARKKIEELSGIPLRGVSAKLRDTYGELVPGSRGRRRKNPEDEILYFESPEDLCCLVELGLIDGECFQDCFNEYLGRLSASA